MRHIGQHFHQVRDSRGLSREQIAKELGYPRQWKGVRKLLIFEMTGHATDEFQVKLAEVLGLDWAEVEEIKDQLYWQWVVAGEVV